MRQRRPRLLDAGFLAFVRTKPCANPSCRHVPAEAAHIRMGNIDIGKPSTGMQEKPDDRWAVPLCAWCHREAPNAQHKMNEGKFWKAVGVDPFQLAAKLYEEYGGTGGVIKIKRTKTKPRRPKEQRQKIRGRTTWPKRRFPSNTPKS